MPHYPIDTLSRNLAQPASRRGLLQFLGVGAAGAAVTAIGVTTAEARKNNKGRKKGRGKGKGNKGDRTNIGPFKTLTGIPLSAQEQGKNFKGTLDIDRAELTDYCVRLLVSATGLAR